MGNEDDNLTWKCPTWSIFNEKQVDEQSPATILGYGPIFPKSPTNPDVVEAAIEYSVSVTRKLDQEYTIPTCDQAIYEICLGFQKEKPRKYSKLLLRMG